MHGTLRAQVVEGHALIVFVDEGGRNLLLCDFVENGGLCEICVGGVCGVGLKRRMRGCLRLDIEFLTHAE